MSVAPFAGVVALDNFKSPTASEDGLQGQVPKPLAGQQTYILSASGWVTAGGGGTGTVTSVSATVPAFLSVSGSPITTSGTLAISYSGIALPVANGGTGVTTSTGTGSVVLSTSPSLTTPTQASYETWTPIAAPSYAEGELWYDSTAHALAYYNDSSTATVHIGQDLQFKVINNTGSTIANGAPVYITGTSSGQTYPNIALAKADVAGTANVAGLTNGSISNGAIGYVTAQGVIDNVNTGTFTVGQVLYLSPYSAGQLQNTVPPTGLTVQVGIVSYVNVSTGKIYVKQTTPLAVSASILTGQVAIANGGTGASTKAAGFNALSPMSAAGDVIYGGTAGAGTALAIGTAGQVLTVNAGATAPVWAAPATSGTVTSISGTGTVSGISLSGTVTSSGSLTLGGTLDLSSPPAIGGTTAAAGTFTTLTATGQTSLGGAAGSEGLRVITTSSAINWIQVAGAITSGNPSIVSAGTDGAIALSLSSKSTSSIFFYTNNLSANSRHLDITHTGSVVNRFQITGSQTGNPVVLGVNGSNADIDITLTPKGAGRVNITTSIKPKVNSAANVTSPLAWNSTSYDEYAITALANALTINADANASPADGQRMMFRFKDNGTARALTWTTGSTNSFRVVGVTLPTTTVASKLVYIGCIYNAADSRWDAVAVSQEA